MSFTEDDIEMMIDDRNNKIHFELRKLGFYDLNYDHIYYDIECLEDYDDDDDFAIHFNYSKDEIEFEYDGYFRLNFDNTLKIKFCTQISRSKDISIYRLREYDDIKDIDELIDIFANKVFHLYKIPFIDEDGDIDFYYKEFENL